MKYLSEILWLLSWPVFIFLTYRLVFWVIKRYEASKPVAETAEKVEAEPEA